MPEMIPQLGKQTYAPPTQAVILELHRLVCIFLASKSFADLRQGPTYRIDTWDHLQESEESEISRILLTVAITARVIDDLHQNPFAFIGGSCGVLEDGQGEKPLSMRDAMNKIIHATSIHFDVDQNEEGQQYVNPTIYLYGDKNGSRWKATMDVLEFAQKYVACIRHF